MDSVQTIFANSLKENKTNPALAHLVQELSFELSRKKLQRLKDPSHIQKRIGELFGLYAQVLKEEELATPELFTCTIDGLIKATSFDQSELLFKRMYEKEQLEKLIAEQKNSIRILIASTYETLEENLDAQSNESLLKALHDSKLRGIEMLGILKETTQEALLTTIEKGSDIEDTAAEITKTISYQAINEGEFTKQRFLDVARAIIDVSVEIADTDQAFAKELLNGCVHGTKEGIAKAVEKFKHDLKFTPEEVETLLGRELSETKKELLKVDEEYVAMLRSCANQSTGVSKGIIEEILDEELDTAFARIQRITHEAAEAISDRIEEMRENASFLEKDFKERASKRLDSLKKEVGELEKKASERMESLRNNPKAQEAKRLGERAWEVAKGMMEGAIKGAKDAMKKESK